MTLRAWLHARTPAAPPRLAARIESALGDRCEASEAQAAEACLGAATDLLTDLLARSSVGRDSALELLTVDALVTYAFEAASSDAATLAATADDAMQRLSAVAS